MAFTKLVKFSDGQYGIRRGFLGLYWYYDMENSYGWHFRGTRLFIRNCRYIEREAKRQFERVTGTDSDTIQRKSAARDVGVPVGSVQAPAREHKL
jgi:hypothetical protein